MDPADPDIESRWRDHLGQPGPAPRHPDGTYAEVTVEVDVRDLDAVVDFTGEVAAVAATLTNLGMTDEARQLLDALDRLDSA